MPRYEPYIIVFFPGVSTIARQNRSLLLHLTPIGNPVVKVKNLEGRVADIDWNGDNYFDVSKTCNVEVSGNGKVGCLYVVFPSIVVPGSEEF
jgi:hypothetical protein